MLKDVLIRLRKINNYTQEDIASICNVSRQAVSKWESGSSIPDIYNCQELAKIYHVSLTELLESDALDTQVIHPNDKYNFGPVTIDEEGCVRIPDEALEKMGWSKGNILLCLGDKTQGLALMDAKKYENFAKQILSIVEKNNENNRNQKLK